MNDDQTQIVDPMAAPAPVDPAVPVVDQPVAPFQAPEPTPAPEQQMPEQPAVETPGVVPAPFEQPVVTPAQPEVAPVEPVAETPVVEQPAV